MRVLGSLPLLLAGCTLSRLEPVPCADNLTCREAFGWGYTCDADAGLCAPAEVEPRCEQTWPTDLLTNREEYADTIVFGAILDRSAAEAEMLAFELPVRQVNDEAGLDGRAFGIIECDTEENGNIDDRNLDESNLDLALWLADSIGVPAILGPQYSSNAIDVYTAVSPYGTLVMSQSATSPALTDIDGGAPTANDPGLFWRTPPPDSLQGKVIASDVAARGVGQVAVIYQNGAYGEGLATVFNAEFNALGGEATLYPFDDSDASLDHFVTVVGSSAEEVLFIASDTDAVKAFLRGAGALADEWGDRGVFLTDGAYYTDVFEETASSAGDLFDQLRGTRPTVDIESATYQFFKASFESTYGVDSTEYAYSAYAYDASWLLIYGAAWATYQQDGVSGENMARGLLKVSSGDEVAIKPTGWPTVRANFAEGRAVDVLGASGELDYDATGEAAAPIEIWTVSCTGGQCTFGVEEVVQPD